MRCRLLSMLRLLVRMSKLNYGTKINIYKKSLLRMVMELIKIEFYIYLVLNFLVFEFSVPTTYRQKFILKGLCTIS